MSHAVNYVVLDDFNVNHDSVQAECNREARHDGDMDCGIEKIKWMGNMEPFDSYKSAERYIENNYENNRYICIAIPFYDNKLPKTKSFLALSDKIKEARAKYTLEFNKKYFINKTEKKKCTTCPTCGSKINISYLYSNICPVCHHDLRPKTVLHKFEKMDKNIKKMEKRKNELITKNIKGRTKKWLLKYEYHC